MYFSVSEATHLGNYKIKITFQNGKSGIADLEGHISEGEIYREIRNPDKFKNFSIEFGTLTWENGEIDVAPETLYEIATGEKISFNYEKTYKAV